MINASGCDAQFEQHRKVHLTDETYGRCVCFLVIHVDLCGRAVHDFDGTLHAQNIVDLRARCACSCLLLATWWAGPSSRTARVGNPNLHFLLDITLVPCPAERDFTRDGPFSPSSLQQNTSIACSRHVACNMVGSASVDDERVGNPTTEVKSIHPSHD